MWHVRNRTEKWLCSREQYVINVKGLLCILKTRHRMMTANLDWLWSCKYPKQKGDCILWHPWYSQFEDFTLNENCIVQRQATHWWFWDAMETEVPLLGIAVCVWARDRYVTGNPPQPVLQKKHLNWGTGRRNICIEREKKRASQLDEGKAVVSIQKTNLFCCCFMQLVGVCQVRR